MQSRNQRSDDAHVRTTTAARAVQFHASFFSKYPTFKISNIIGKKKFPTGRIFSDAALPGLSPSERAAIYESAAETLARLHRVDFVRAGLEGFGRAKGSYLGRQVATLERVAAKQVCRSVIMCRDPAVRVFAEAFPWRVL